MFVKVKSPMLNKFCKYCEELFVIALNSIQQYKDNNFVGH